MLPEQYKGIDVRTFFPEYKPNGSLRFSRLFPIKPSLRPNIWKNVRRRFKKKLENEDEPAKKKPKEGQFAQRSLKNMIIYLLDISYPKLCNNQNNFSRHL